MEYADPGVDGPTWAAYGAHRDPTLRDGSDRLQRGASQAPPVARGSLPKADGRPRPSGTPARDDTSVQRATGEVRNPL